MAQSRGSYFQVSYPMNHNPGHSFLLEDNEESFPSQNRFRNAFQQMNCSVHSSQTKKGSLSSKFLRSKIKILIFEKIVFFYWCFDKYLITEKKNNNLLRLLKVKTIIANNFIWSAFMCIKPINFSKIASVHRNLKCSLNWITKNFFWKYKKSLLSFCVSTEFTRKEFNFRNMILNQNTDSH